MYIDCLTYEDICFHAYEAHRETVPFDDIVLFTGWLACGSHKTTAYLSERVMRQFRYMQHFLIPPFECAPPMVKQMDMDDIFDDYLNHLVSDEVQSTIAPKDWSYEDGYIL